MQAKDRHYGFDFCPAFWDWLEAHNQAGLVFSIERVGAEIQAGGGELATWAAQRGPGFFLPPHGAIQPEFARLSAWAVSHGYDQGAVNTFFQAADYYLIAHAMASGDTVVTHEVAANTVKTIKIPNACAGLNVPCINPFQMLRTEGARFILGPQP